MQMLPDFVRENDKYFDFRSYTLHEDAPVALKKKFEIWYNSNFSFDDEGKTDPWRTWDGKVIEKRERSKRPEFRK